MWIGGEELGVNYACILRIILCTPIMEHVNNFA